MKRNKRRLGDRYDGRLLRKIDPFFKIVPYIMKTRVDSQVYFDYRIDLEKIDTFLKEKRNSGIRDIKFLHIVVASMVRTISQKPRINRFIAGQRIFARNEILISLALKKQMNEDSLETTIKLKFNPDDTLREVADKLNASIGENKADASKNDTDKTAEIFTRLPRFILKFAVWLLTTLDYYGLMPKIINEVSPFHTSVFITDLGSLGIQPVYHHIYEFGTTSIFVAFGTKLKERVLDSNNNYTEKKYVNIKVVADERTVDGYYYATAFKLFKKYLENPERLEVVPEKIVEDLE